MGVNNARLFSYGLLNLEVHYPHDQNCDHDQMLRCDYPALDGTKYAGWQNLMVCLN